MILKPSDTFKFPARIQANTTKRREIGKKKKKNAFKDMLTTLHFTKLFKIARLNILELILRRRKNVDILLRLIYQFLKKL